MSVVHYAAHPLPVTLTNTPCRFCQPIPVPSATQNSILVQSIISINALLSVIGYAHNNIEEDFVQPMHKEFLTILHANEGEEKKFTGKQLTFIEDVSSVITGIDIILTDRLLDDVTVASPKMKEIWFALAWVNMNLQTMLSAVDVRLSMLWMLREVIPAPSPAKKSFQALDALSTGERYTALNAALIASITDDEDGAGLSDTDTDVPDLE